MTQATLHEFPGREYLFEWLPEDDIPNEAALAALVLAAFDVLSVVVQPLSADLSLVCADAESRFAEDDARPAKAFHHLRVQSLPADVHCAPMFNNAQTQSTAQLDTKSLQAWIDAALAQPGCAAGQISAWESLFIEATRARIDSDALELKDPGGAALQINVEGGWAAGPHPHFPTQAPIAIAAHNEGGALRLKINVHWSCWSDPRSSGARALQAALTQLQTLDWQSVE